MISRILSLVLALVCVACVVADQGGMTPTVLKIALALLLPLALIWFPEPLGSMTGYVGRGGTIDTPSPPFLVSFLGWAILLSLTLLGFL